MFNHHQENLSGRRIEYNYWNIISAVVSVVAYGLKKWISTAVKDMDREKDIEAHKQQVNYDNTQALLLFQDKMRLQGIHTSLAWS